MGALSFKDDPVFQHFTPVSRLKDKSRCTQVDSGNVSLRGKRMEKNVRGAGGKSPSRVAYALAFETPELLSFPTSSHSRATHRS